MALGHAARRSGAGVTAAARRRHLKPAPAALESCAGSVADRCPHLDNVMDLHEQIGSLRGQLSELIQSVNHINERVETTQASVIDLRHDISAQSSERAQHQAAALGRIGIIETRIRRLESWVPLVTWMHKHRKGLQWTAGVAIAAAATIWGSDIKAAVRDWWIARGLR